MLITSTAAAAITVKIRMPIDYTIPWGGVKRKQAAYREDVILKEPISKDTLMVPTCFDGVYLHGLSIT